MSKQFTTDHVWIQAHADGTATVGITVHAQEALGDVVFVELPAIGAHLTQGAVAGVVVNTASTSC